MIFQGRSLSAEIVQATYATIVTAAIINMARSKNGICRRRQMTLRNPNAVRPARNRKTSAVTSRKF
jgi:hypothetical protein